MLEKIELNQNYICQPADIGIRNIILLNVKINKLLDTIRIIFTVIVCFSGSAFEKNSWFQQHRIPKKNYLVSYGTKLVL